MIIFNISKTLPDTWISKICRLWFEFTPEITMVTLLIMIFPMLHFGKLKLFVLRIFCRKPQFYPFRNHICHIFTDLHLSRWETEEVLAVISILFIIFAVQIQVIDNFIFLIQIVLFMIFLIFLELACLAEKKRNSHYLT